MGKLWDYLMAKDWEEFQRIQLYKNIGKYLSEKKLSPEQMREIERIIKKK